jgi:hypothetical protein
MQCRQHCLMFTRGNAFAGWALLLLILIVTLTSRIA